MTQETEDVVGRLRRAAISASDISRRMAEDKSLRQEGNHERRTDLYMWPTPEQTIEGKAADLIQSLSERLAVQDDLLRRARLLIRPYCEADEELRAFSDDLTVCLVEGGG